MDIKSVISKLGGDLDRLRDDYLKVSGTLARFGLSEYGRGRTSRSWLWVQVRLAM